MLVYDDENSSNNIITRGMSEEKCAKRNTKIGLRRFYRRLEMANSFFVVWKMEKQRENKCKM